MKLVRSAKIQHSINLSNIARDFVPSKLYLHLMMPNNKFYFFLFLLGGGKAQADSSFRSRERVHRSNFRAFPY